MTTEQSTLKIILLILLTLYPTKTFAQVGTASPTMPPMASMTSTYTPTPTFTNTHTPTLTHTITVSPTNSFTSTPVITYTPSPSLALTMTATVTSTITSTITYTPTYTNTLSPTSTTVSLSPTHTLTPTYTPAHTPTSTPSHSPTHTSTVVIVTSTPTFTSTLTPTVTPTVTPTRWCDTAVELSCPDAVLGDTTGKEQNITVYGCTADIFLGPEEYYYIVPTVDLNITVTLTYFGLYNLDVLILSGCDPSSCIAQGDLSATATLLAGAKYYVVVDGAGLINYEGSYLMTVFCDPLPTKTPTVTPSPTPTGTFYTATPSPTPTPTTFCDTGNELLCNAIMFSDTSGNPNNFSTYDCSFALFPGPEDIYVFKPGTDVTLTARLRNMGSINLDLVVMEGCDPATCIATGDNEINVFLATGKTYYIVVDEKILFGATGGPYSLETLCEYETPSIPMINKTTGLIYLLSLGVLILLVINRGKLWPE